MDKVDKVPYVCGPLTELPVEMQKLVKSFYSKIADLTEKITGIRGFVPHEHYDPIKHANYEPQEVDVAERHQVCNCTSCLIIVAIAPSWGGGIEVEMANNYGVPAIILCEAEKLAQRKISRLLRGNPAIKAIIAYNSEEEALDLLAKELAIILHE